LEFLRLYTAEAAAAEATTNTKNFQFQFEMVQNVKRLPPPFIGPPLRPPRNPWNPIPVIL